MEDVHKLRVFSAVAQYLSFTKAAQTLFLTQSAVSHQIAALERSMSTPLIDRRSKRISLTPAGIVLRDHCSRIFTVLEEASLAVKRTTHPDLGAMRIGASPAACQYLIPESLREFRESYPDYEISIAVGDSPHISRQLLDGSIDLGVLIRAERDRHLRFHDLFTDELGFLVSPLHPWALRRHVDRRQIADQRFVLYTRTSATFHLIERHLLRLQVSLRAFTELGSMEAIKELVKLGLGISIAAPWIASAELTQGSLVWLKIPGPPLRRNWCIASRSEHRTTIAEQTFLGLCRSTADNLLLNATSAIKSR